jgi:hypothetical protein
MKKKIATLEVWVDENSDGVSRLESIPAIGEYKVVMNPKADAEEQAIVRHDSKRSFATILAHELGHFVSQVLQSPWQRCPWKEPGEREAWAVAHQIMPDLDKELEQSALNTYTQDHCTCGLPWCRNAKPPKELQRSLMKAFEATKIA